MKKLLFCIALSWFMIFILATGTLGASVYLDGMVANNLYDSNGIREEYVIGVNIPLGCFKIGLEHAEIKDISHIGTDYDELKGGYRFIQKNKNQLYGTLAYYKEDQDKNYMSYQTIVLGLDGTYFITEKVNLDGSLGISLNGKYKAVPKIEHDAYLILVMLKLNYLLTDSMSVSIGFRFANLSGEFMSGDTYERPKALILGLNYKF